MNGLKELKHYITRTSKMTISTYMAIFVWWFITYTINLWTKKQVFFSLDIFSKGGNMLLKSIVPCLILILIFVPIRAIIDKAFFRVYRDTNGVHIKNLLWRDAYISIYAAVTILVILLQIVLQFGELQKTLKVLAIIGGLLVLLNITSVNIDKKKIKNWAVKQAGGDKFVCAYLSSDDFLESLDTDNNIFATWLDKQKIFANSVSPAGINRIFETEDSIICPYWIYKEYLQGLSGNPLNRLLIVADGTYQEKDNDFIGQIVDEYLDNSKLVFKFELSRKWCCQAVAERPIYSFGDEEHMIEIMSQKEICQKVSFFDKGELVLPYTVGKERYLKYKFIYNELYTLSLGKSDTTACFYHLLKLVEYVWHYRALYALAVNGNPMNLFKDKSLQSSMGLWNSLQDKIQTKYIDDEKIKAYQLINSVLLGAPCNVKTIRYSDICNILTQLRNRYVGHGTMAFSVSEELLDAVKVLVLEILQLFYQDENQLLMPNMMATAYVPCVQSDNGNGQLIQRLLIGYIKGDCDVYEYLDYVSGNISSNIKIVYQLDYMETEMK